MSVIPVLVAARVVNRLGGAGMAFLGVRLTRDLGVPLGTTGTVLAVFGLATIPSRVLGGVVTTRWGPRAALVGGLVACAVAQAVIAAGSSLRVVAAGVVLLGLAYEVVEPATQTAVVTGVDPARRASRLSLLWACISVAGVLAGVVAALVTRWGVGALFAVDAATSLAAAGLVAVLLPALPAVRVRRAWRAALHRRLLAWTALCCVPTTVVMVVVLVLPLVVEQDGRPPSTTAWLLAAAAAVSLATQRMLARVEPRLPAHLVLASGYALLGVALLVWALGGLAALVVGAVLEGAAGTLVVGTQQAVASRLAPAGSEAAVMTVQGLSWGVATVVAPVLGTALLGAGAHVLWLTGAAVALVLAAGHVRPPARWAAPAGVAG
ncbi:MFS transporter [Phycicoccus flavus]|uniref:MFS transporter n=1 Tax=Phycicoccus flavus TaxID=2502783 RepID=UPI000FEC057D|nr:MFS transporter [Phycicoccus flavus]NHA69394.1 MFS transporter [Phycicoccus flavus]